MQKPCEVIEHLANSVCGDRQWRDTLITMYTAYFDASGHEGNPGTQPTRFLVVAGFLADANDWISFNKKWENRLLQEGIRNFKATQHADRNLRERLIDIIKCLGPQKFSCAVKIPDLHGMPKELLDRYYLRAYALAGRCVVQRMLKWTKSFHSRYAPEVFFEDGDAGKEELERRLVLDGFPRPQFKPKKDRKVSGGLIERGLVPFQAADFFANEVFKASCRGDVDSWEMQEFLRIQGGYMGAVASEEIESLQTNLRMLDFTKFLDKTKK